VKEVNPQQEQEVELESLPLGDRADQLLGNPPESTTDKWQDSDALSQGAESQGADRLPQLDWELDPPKRSRFKAIRWLIMLVVLGAIAGGSYLIYQNYTASQNRESRRRARTVKVERLTLPITVSANGTVQPEMLINVSPKTSGRLKQLLVKQGDRVEAGQVLATMDNSNLAGQLTQAQGQVAAAEAKLQKLLAGNREQEIAQAQATLNSDRANLQQTESTFNQNQKLFNDGAISERELTKSRSDYDAAKAKVAQSQQALSLQQAGSRPEDIAEARAQVISAQGSLQVIQSQIEDTAIRAPFSGIVTRKYADPGAFVTPTTSGSSVSSATASSILSLASTNRVIANVAEVNIALVKLGQEVKIQADAYPGESFKGKTIEISPQSTVQQNVTSFEVKVAILNDPNLKLRSGMNVNVDFKVGKLENALVVPTVAITRQAGGTGVFVRKEGEAPVFTPIVTGVTANDKTEVKSGLNGDEKVLISFPEGMRPQSTIPGGIPGLQPRVR
jgi:HlyD family secretion protein